MRRFVFSAMTLALLLVAAGRSADDGGATKDNVPLSGFTALFNGKDLTNWQGLVELPSRAKQTPDQLAELVKKANEKILPHWTVKDGVLQYDGKANSLQTVKDYYDFELWVDWKIGPKGDSGIYLRGNPQVQIWDNPEGSGGLYNNKYHARKPIKYADKPVGEWNRFRIVMKKDKTSIWLNGVLVTDDTELENYWQPGLPLPVRGPIELQHHGDKLEFKNIFVKELP